MCLINHMGRNLGLLMEETCRNCETRALQDGVWVGVEFWEAETLPYSAKTLL